MNIRGNPKIQKSPEFQGSRKEREREREGETNNEFMIWLPLSTDMHCTVAHALFNLPAAGTELLVLHEQMYEWFR